MSTTDMQTVPAPAQSSAPPRSDSAAAFSKFGTIGYDLYVAVVVAESERLFRNRMNQGTP